MLYPAGTKLSSNYPSTSPLPPLLSGVRDLGHLVAAQPYCDGRRAGSPVVHTRLGVRHIDLNSHGRALGGELSWGGWNIRVVGGHADARGDRIPYQQIIDDIEFSVDRTPHDRTVLPGADAQDTLGPQRAFDDPSILCEHAVGQRGWMGERFMRMPLSHPASLAHGVLA